jgi:hypothetical protein
MSAIPTDRLNDWQKLLSLVVLCSLSHRHIRHTQTIISWTHYCKWRQSCPCAMKTYGMYRRIDPRILDLGTRHVSSQLYDPAALWPRKEAQCPLDKRLVRPLSHSQSLCDWRSVNQSRGLGVEPQLGFMIVWQLRSCPVRAPSLTRVWFCVLSVTVSSLYQCVHGLFTVSHVWHVLVYILNTRPVSPGSVQKIMHY